MEQICNRKIPFVPITITCALHNVGQLWNISQRFKEALESKKALNPFLDSLKKALNSKVFQLRSHNDPIIHQGLLCVIVVVPSICKASLHMV